MIVTYPGAVCTQADPELWFSDVFDEVQQARALCRTCPARNRCLEEASARRESYGVWGGELFRDGQVTTPRRRGRPPQAQAGAA